MIGRLVRSLSLVALATFSVSCSSVPVGGAAAPQLITPRQAIERAADAAPAGVDGVFDVNVRATGHQDGIIYLNSENDYRDQRNLTVDIPPAAAAALQAKYGESPETFFKGKHLAVTGQAKRVTIWFSCHGVQTEKYYYQTHVEVADPSQLQVLQ